MTGQFRIIKKIERKSSNCIIFKYFIKFENNRPDGDCCIFLQRFQTLKNPFSGINKQQQSRWRKLGLANADFFACLDDFYPNGRYFSGRDVHLRKGTGGKVLDELLQDILPLAPKLIYGIPTSDEIKKFLLANNWKSDYKNNKVMYRLLGISQ
jgi:hypothetical protein